MKALFLGLIRVCEGDNKCYLKYLQVQTVTSVWHCFHFRKANERGQILQTSEAENIGTIPRSIAVDIWFMDNIQNISIYVETVEKKALKVSAHLIRGSLVHYKSWMSALQCKTIWSMFSSKPALTLRAAGNWFVSESWLNFWKVIRDVCSPL